MLEIILIFVRDLKSLDSNSGCPATIGNCVSIGVLPVELRCVNEVFYCCKDKKTWLTDSHSLLKAVSECLPSPTPF